MIIKVKKKSHVATQRLNCNLAVSVSEAWLALVIVGCGEIMGLGKSSNSKVKFVCFTLSKSSLHSLFIISLQHSLFGEYGSDTLCPRLSIDLPSGCSTNRPESGFYTALNPYSDITAIGQHIE